MADDGYFAFDWAPIPDELRARIVAHFRAIADSPIGDATGHARGYAEFRRERAAVVAADPGGLSELDARWAIDELVYEGFWRRSSAYADAPAEVRDRIPGGFISRTQSHGLAPEADWFDAMAIAIARSVPGWSPEIRLLLVTG